MLILNKPVAIKHKKFKINVVAQDKKVANNGCKKL